MTIVFAKPSTGDIKVSVPPFPLRYNNKERCFAFQADGFIRDENENPIMPDAAIVGLSHFYGELRTREDEQTKEVTPITEKIWVLYWIVLPSPKNKHEFLPVGSLIATYLVTKAQQNFEKHMAVVQNSGKALYEVVTTFKAGKYETKNRKGIDTLEFVVVDDAKVDKTTKEYLKKVATWIEGEGKDIVSKIGEQAYDGSLVPISGNATIDAAAIAQYHALKGNAPVMLSAAVDDGADFDTTVDV
jgi:hypothetical protein